MARNTDLVTLLRKAYDAGVKAGRLRTFADSLKELRRLEKDGRTISTKSVASALQTGSRLHGPSVVAPEKRGRVGKRTTSNHRTDKGDHGSISPGAQDRLA